MIAGASYYTYCYLSDNCSFGDFNLGRALLMIFFLIVLIIGLEIWAKRKR